MTEPQGEQKEITQEELDQVTKAFEGIVKDVNQGYKEFSNKDITSLLVSLTPTLIKFEVAIHNLESRVTELENKK
jgi:exonuclease VII small subunit